MRSPPRSPRPSARPSAPRCQPTQPDLAREAATREDCCGRERGPGNVEGGREGGRGGGRESLFGPLALQICRPGRVYYRSVDTCVSRRRVCESAALDARTAGGGWPLSVSSASHVGSWCRSRGAFCLRSVSECLVPVRAASRAVCVFDLVPHTYRIHHTRGANARQLITAHITRFYLNLSTPRGVLYSGVRTCAASSCCKRSLSVRSTPPSSFGSSCVAACTATGGKGAVSK